MSSVATTGIAAITAMAAGSPTTTLAPILSDKLDAHGGSHDTPTAFVVDRETSKRKSLESLVLLFLRLAAAVALLEQAIAGLLTGHSVQSDIFAVLVSGAAILLLTGLWTPFAGTLTAFVEVGNLLSRSGTPWTCMQLGTIGGALAMLGSGGWSLDARCFGKRISLRFNRFSFVRLRNPLRRRGAPRYHKRVIQ